MRARWGWTAIALVAGCGGRPRVVEGERCELNTECVAPLVCRLERCRMECREKRDCAPARACVHDADGLGVCQVTSDAECAHDSDCPEPLVCAFGQCRDRCETRRDCPAGALCVNDAMLGNACVDVAGVPCRHTSDCEPPLVCGLDGSCRPECVEDRDCRPGSGCDTASTPHVCVTSPDAGLVAPADSGPAPDAGVVTDASSAPDA